MAEILSWDFLIRAWLSSAIPIPIPICAILGGDLLSLGEVDFLRGEFLSYATDGSYATDELTPYSIGETPTGLNYSYTTDFPLSIGEAAWAIIGEAAYGLKGEYPFDLLR